MLNFRLFLQFLKIFKQKGVMKIMRVVTMKEFNEMALVEQARYLQEVKVSINRSNDDLLKDMMQIVEEEVMQTQEFYIRDVEVLRNAKKDQLFLWIASVNGTLLYNLMSDEFEEEQWAIKKQFNEFYQKYRNFLCGCFLIEQRQMHSLSVPSVFATLAIYEDIAIKNKELLERKKRWLVVS